MNLAAPLSIVTIDNDPENVLRTPCRPVVLPDMIDEVRQWVAEMTRLIMDYNGAGLAANQAGLPWRFFVEWTDRTELVPRVFINPRIVKTRGGLVGGVEGCLSCPGVQVGKKRHRAITIEATRLGSAGTLWQASDYRARCWQHEIDHLDGKLIVDTNERHP